MTTKIDQGLEEPNPGGGGGGGGGSTSTSTPPGPPDDRISELPKEILHHILGFLEMDEFLIGTSLVSTKWRNLWKSVSTLKFPICTRRRIFDNGGGGIRNNVEKYKNFVDRVLRLRDSEASKIRYFSYCYNDFKYSRGRGGGGVGYDYLELIHNFIVSAVVNQGAQEIEINGYSRQKGDGNNNTMILHFNPSIFTSGELLQKFIFGALFSGSNFIIQFPRSMCCATQLKHLGLTGIRLPEGDDDDAQLHLVCPLLETLVISNCYTEHLKVLDISAPRLNSLRICNIGMRRGHFDGLGGCRLEIRTPNLTSLDFCGDVYGDCFMENLPHIANAIIQIYKQQPGMQLEQTTPFAIKLLQGLTSAESLSLGGFEVFSQDTLKVLLTPFTSLRTLELITSCDTSSIHGMVHIINSCNSIEKFVWEFAEEEGDGHLMLPQCRLSHLKHVHINRLHGNDPNENEIEFVKFLLKSSVVLEDLIITISKKSLDLIINTTEKSPKRLINLIEENLKQFIEEEPSLKSIKLQIL